MPSHEVHRRVTRLLLGREYQDVHSFKDRPVVVLKGRHRVLRHDPLTNLRLAAETGDPGAFLAGTLHDVTDAVDSALRRVERVNSRRRRRRR